MQLRRVVIVGLDGASFNHIDPLMQSGRMPNLTRLMKQGCYGVLRSTIPPMSPVAWSSFVTGMSPGQHGIFGWRARSPDSYERLPISPSERNGKTIWRILSDAEYCVAVLGLPMSYPPERVNGIMVSGFDTPEGARGFSWPSDLIQDLEEAGYKYETAPRSLHHRAGMSREEYLHSWMMVERERARATGYILEKYKPDCLMVLFPITDHFNHKGGRLHHLYRAYECADQCLGDILKKVDERETLVFVVSDHGSMTFRYFFYLNLWLMRQGLLRFKDCMSLDNLVHVFDSLFKQLYGGWSSAGLMGQLARIMVAAWPLLPRRVKRRVTWWIRYVTKYGYSYDQIDWPKVKAYGVIGYGQIYLNVKGRDPMGVVEPGSEYEDLRNQLIARLSELRDPLTDELLIDHVCRREDVYHGPFVHRAPDICFSYRNKRDFTMNFHFKARSPIVDFGQLNSNGDHTAEGILVVSGPNIRQGTLSGARIVDIAPTLLHVFGLPVPSEMEGRVLTDMFCDASAITTMPRQEVSLDNGEVNTSTQTFSEADFSEVEKRLRALGYL
jgi:predicted AlkP superfamily phosphohydrolase/phosphomutase